MACWFALQFFANSSCTQAVPWNRPMQIQIDPDGHPSDPVCKKHSVTQLWDYQLRIGLTNYPGCTWKWFVYLGSRMCLLLPFVGDPCNHPGLAGFHIHRRQFPIGGTSLRTPFKHCFRWRLNPKWKQIGFWRGDSSLPKKHQPRNRDRILHLWQLALSETNCKKKLLVHGCVGFYQLFSTSWNGSTNPVHDQTSFWAQIKPEDVPWVVLLVVINHWAPGPIYDPPNTSL